MGVILDLFAGPGGWDQGLRDLGYRGDVVGIEWDAAACQTRAAAGHATIRADVAAYPTEPFAGKVTGLIASPPCQDFSLAGKRAGIEGERGQLVAEVLRWARALDPEWIACEQVPPVLPIWELYAHELGKDGYRTWAGILNAADFGVPQTRKRAILIATRGPLRVPDPTHGKDPHPSMFGPSLRPWVTMAQALGWGYNEQPGPVVMTARNRQTGHDVLRGSSWRQEHMRQAMREGRWLRMGNAAGASVRHINEPAPAVMFGHRANAVEWHPERPPTREELEGAGLGAAPSGPSAGAVRVTVQEAAVLQSFPPDYPWQGSKTKRFEQVGNAIPPGLAAAILDPLIE